MFKPSVTFMKPIQQAGGPVGDGLKRYFGPKGAECQGTLVNEIGRASLPVLEQLWGTPLDNLLLNLLPSLAPSTVRITTGETTQDYVDRRVTVFIDDQHVIQSIKQECQVSLAGGHDSGQRVVETMTLRHEQRRARAAVVKA